MASADLASWLLEQIAEDERVALEADGLSDIAASDRDAPFLADWRPARVLAECEAKKRIIEEHEHHGEGSRRYCMTCHDRMEYGWCLTVRCLALPFADRPGYQEEWKP